MNDKDREARIEALDRAIDALLAVRAELEGVGEAALPDLAFDVALGQCPDYQDARAAFAAALEELFGKVTEDRDAVLVVEGVANLVVWRAAEVAWRMGLRGR